LLLKSLPRLPLIKEPLALLIRQIRQLANRLAGRIRIENPLAIRPAERGRLLGQAFQTGLALRFQDVGLADL
jgi:hypothetical protein